MKESKDGTGHREMENSAETDRRGKERADEGR